MDATVSLAQSIHSWALQSSRCYGGLHRQSYYGSLVSTKSGRMYKAFDLSGSDKTSAVLVHDIP